MTTSTVMPVGTPTGALTTLLEAIDGYIASSALSVLSDADLIAELRVRELARRRLESADHAMVAELEQRGLGAAYGARSTAGLYVDVLRLSLGDARARVIAGQELGPRPTLSGGVLAPQLPMAASAREAGDMSVDHVGAIIATMRDLSSCLSVQDRAEAELILTTVAQQCTPREVINVGARLVDTLNPDGQAPEDRERDKQRVRSLGLRRRRDGMYELTARLTAECGIDAEAVLHAYAAPQPAVCTGDSTDGSITDQRSFAQRMHDALQDIMGLALRADTLESTGRRAELVLSATLVHDVRDSDGSVQDSDTAHAIGPAPVNSARRRRLGPIAWTSFGDPLSMGTALALCDTALIATVALASEGAVLNYGRTRRFATKAQLRALIARDGGCSFPGCDHPPQWCDAHHIRAWIDGGRTDLENLTLLCGYHHRNFQRMKWQCGITEGVPEWTPPEHVDPYRQPRRNFRYLVR